MQVGLYHCAMGAVVCQPRWDHQGGYFETRGIPAILRRAD